MIKEIKFPCCVPTSEIKDAETLLALVALFEAKGATVYDGVDCDVDVDANVYVDNDFKVDAVDVDVAV